MVIDLNNFQRPDGRANQPQQRTLILDLGDVLFYHSTANLTVLTRQELQAVLISNTWTELDRGHINEEEALVKIGKCLSLDPSAIKEALSQCRKTLRVDQDIVDEIVKLKKQMNGNLKIYAMSNVSKDDFVRLKSILSDWSLFDGEFTSCEVGMAKPELNFYKHVLEKIGVSNPSSVVFVDDKILNVITARCLGIQGIVFKSSESLLRQLRNMLFDPVLRGREFMAANSRKHTSQIEGGPEFSDSFSQFLIHCELKDPSLLNLSSPDASEAQIEADLERLQSEAKLWNYFTSNPVGTTKSFPDDLDDTALALLAFSPPAASANAILDRMVTTRDEKDNLIMIYFSEDRLRVCPFVIVNVIRVFYHYNRGAELKGELNYIRDILLNRGYIDGTATYNSAEPFLYFMSCLIHTNPDQPEIQCLREPTAAALRERVGRQGDSFAVAARVLACQKLDVWAHPDIEYLKEMQQCDGGWEIGWLCHFSRSLKRIGNRGVPTAWAIKALEHEYKAQGEP